jgi:hypothetical protein
MLSTHKNVPEPIGSIPKIAVICIWFICENQRDIMTKAIADALLLSGEVLAASGG